jgi:hypothetical protein
MPGVVAVAAAVSDGLGAKLNALHGDIRGVISIGLAGRLSPRLKWAMCDRRQGSYRRGRLGLRRGWRVRLASRLPYAIRAPVRQRRDHRTPRTKSGLHDTTGALAVDMESQVAARFAASRKLPLAGLRVISDDATHVLPPAALVAMKPDGRLALGRVLWSLLKKPAQIPALVHTARTSNKAFAELLRCRDLCGVGFSGADL